jgi:hypothetical protein
MSNYIDSRISSNVGPTVTFRDDVLLHKKNIVKISILENNYNILNYSKRNRKESSEVVHTFLLFFWPFKWLTKFFRKNDLT